MSSFLIASYNLRLELQRVGNPVNTVRNRVLEIVSVPEFHGIIERAVLNFSTSFDNWQTSPVVGYYSTANLLRPVITGWLPSSEYSFWYDVLRSEKPLTFSYTITPINGANYVSAVTVGTSTEPVGEGPVDLSP